MADVLTPRSHDYRLGAVRSLTEIQRWGSEVDARIVEILACLNEATSRVNVLTTKSTPGSIGAHAPQHYPQTGFDPLLTAAPSGGFALTAAKGTSNNLMRADATLLFPTKLAEYTFNSTLALTATGSSQVLTGNNGEVQVRSANNQISLDLWTGGGGSSGSPGTVLNFDVSTVTAGTNLTSGIVGSVAFQSGTYTSATLAGGRFQVNTQTGATYTTVAVRAMSAIVLTPGNLSGTNSFTERTALYVQPGTVGGASTTTTDVFGIKMNTWPVIGSVGTTTNARAALFTLPTCGATIRRGLEISTQTQNLGTEAADVEAIEIGSIQKGTSTRKSLHCQGAAVGTPTEVYGVLVEAHTVGTDRWGVKTNNKIENTSTDFICNTTAKGYITKDAQGSPRYWRMHINTTGSTSVDATMAVDVNGILSVTRGGSPAGTVNLNLVDVGTTAPTL